MGGPGVSGWGGDGDSGAVEEEKGEIEGKRFFGKWGHRRGRRTLERVRGAGHGLASAV
jgi:hypothetical protein